MLLGIAGRGGARSPGGSIGLSRSLRGWPFLSALARGGGGARRSRPSSGRADPSLRARLVYWRAGWAGVLERPWTGFGPDRPRGPWRLSCGRCPGSTRPERSSASSICCRSPSPTRSAWWASPCLAIGWVFVGRRLAVLGPPDRQRGRSGTARPPPAEPAGASGARPGRLDGPRRRPGHGAGDGRLADRGAAGGGGDRRGGGAGGQPAAGRRGWPGGGSGQPATRLRRVSRRRRPGRWRGPDAAERSGAPAAAWPALALAVAFLCGAGVVLVPLDRAELAYERFVQSPDGDGSGVTEPGGARQDRSVAALNDALRLDPTFPALSLPGRTLGVAVRVGRPADVSPAGRVAAPPARPSAPLAMPAAWRPSGSAAGRRPPPPDSPRSPRPPSRPHAASIPWEPGAVQPDDGRLPALPPRRPRCPRPRRRAPAGCRAVLEGPAPAPGAGPRGALRGGGNRRRLARAGGRPSARALPSAQGPGAPPVASVALVVDGRPASSLSLHAFRRLPRRVALVPVPVIQPMAQALSSLPPATALPGDRPPPLPPTCTGPFSPQTLRKTLWKTW